MRMPTRRADGPAYPLSSVQRVVGGASLVGSSLALLFWVQSLTPTLIPRSWEAQAMIGGTCVALGYAIGAWAGRGIGRVVKPRRRLPVRSIRRYGWLLLGVAWPAAALLGSAAWLAWQNEQRDFMGMTSLGRTEALLMGALSPLAGVLPIVVGGLAVRAASTGLRSVQGHLPGRAAMPITLLLLAAAALVLGREAVLHAVTAFAHSVYAPMNEETTEGTFRPNSPSVSGSAASLVEWDTLGRQGRDFVASVTTGRQLTLFHGTETPITEPVRVYVGVRSAASAAERAALAVRELERAGGFDRKVLVVWVPTGTGWMIPEATAALEQLHRGDTAIVALQYSFLPSLVGVFLDSGLANDAGRVLFRAVHARWSALPSRQRPKLVLFGKSLGTAGVEEPFVGPDASSSVANLVARTDGALIVGPKHSNPIHAQLTSERKPTSPAWQPVFAEGRSVRFLNRDPKRPGLGGEWRPPRIVYLQHPSDPVTFWSLDVLWRPPEWMDEPRGFDVPRALRWFPIVSGVQAVRDLLDQLDTPPGFGHVYTTEYVRGWVSVAPPEGWDETETERLERYIADIAGGDAED